MEKSSALEETFLSMLDGFLSVNGFYCETGFESWYKLHDLLYHWKKTSFPPRFIILFLDNEFKTDPPETRNILYLGEKVDKLIEYFKIQLAQELQVPKPA